MILNGERVQIETPKNESDPIVQTPPNLPESKEELNEKNQINQTATSPVVESVKTVEPESIKAPVQRANIDSPSSTIINTPSDSTNINLRSPIAQKVFDGKYRLIRILKLIPPLVGEDFKIYGPFKEEDLTYLPSKNAAILIEEKLAKPLGES